MKSEETSVKEQTGKKTLYVHIGMAKTGTTALQYFLWENRGVLEQKGYCYPSMRLAYPDVATVNETRNGHFLVNDTWVNGSMEHDNLDAMMYRAGMDEVVRLFEIYDNVILSDEGIWVATYKRRASLWEELLADGERNGFQVKIVVYLRRQDQYIASVYKQKLKQRTSYSNRETWEEYVSHIPKTRQLDYFKKLERIRKVVGMDHMIVCKYDRESFLGGSLYADFLHRIGLEFTDAYEVAQQEANKSLLGNTAEMKRIINEIGDFDRDDDRLIRNILYDDSEISKNQVIAEVFSKEEAESFLRKYDQSNAKVAETYFDDGKPLFDNTVPDIPKYDRNNPYMMEDILRFAAIGLKYLRRDQAAAGGQIRELQKQLAKSEGEVIRLERQTEKLQKQMDKLQGQMAQHNQETKNVRGELYETRDKLHHPIRAVFSRITKS